MLQPKNSLNYILRKFSVVINQPSPMLIRGSRWRELVDIFRELNFTSGAEIGVEQGKYSEALCQNIPGLKLFCIDPWQSYDRYNSPISQIKLDKFYYEAKSRLAPYYCQIIKKPSIEAVGKFAPQSLDFVFIDGNHEFDYVVTDIINWAKIVRSGGIVAGHDYKPDEPGRYPFHVITATQAYTSAHQIQPWFVLQGDVAPSWFWVKD